MTNGDQETPPHAHHPGDASTTASAPLQEVAGALRLGALSALLVSDLRAGRRATEETLGALGLSDTHAYTVVVADAAAAGDMEAWLAQSAAKDALPVVQSIIDRWLFALVPGPVDSGDFAAVTIGRSVRRPLADVAQSFAEAEQALRTAQAFGVTGIVDLEQLTPLPLVTATSGLAASASASIFARLDALGPAGREIETAVAALLAHDQNIDATAAALDVHRNTIRARRNRFHELTGLDITHTADLVTAWWLLHWRQAQR